MAYLGNALHCLNQDGYFSLSLKMDYSYGFPRNLSGCAGHRVHLQSTVNGSMSGRLPHKPIQRDCSDGPGGSISPLALPPTPFPSPMSL